MGCPPAKGSNMPDTFTESFDIRSQDFAAAGEVSAKIKSILRLLGINPAVIRRVAIAAYEAELNMVIHSKGGKMSIAITPDNIALLCSDTGPGINDIQMAMREGFSTASPNIRMMGFGAGMGLPNIKKNCDDFLIKSDNNGTVLDLRFFI